MARKRIDPKLPIAPTAGDDPATSLMRPDSYFDRLVRRLNELFREIDDGTIAVFDEETYIGQASGLNFTGAGVTASQAANLPTGNYDITIPGGGGGGGTVDTLEVEAAEDVDADDLINIFEDSGSFKGRLAKASTNGYEAHGFADAATLTGATITVRFLGKVTSSSGLTPGQVFLSETPGKATSTCPSGAGKVAQQVGASESATSFAFEWQPAVLLAAAHSVTTGGNSSSQTFTTNNTFVATVSLALVTMIGGGGGGKASTTSLAGAGGGGGSGEYCIDLPIPLTVGETVTVTVGTGGAGGATSGASGSDGGTTSISCLAGTFAVVGGKGATSAQGASGGGPRGGTGGTTSSPGNPGSLGTAETPVHFGGSGGGGGGNTTSAGGGAGAGAPGILTGGAGGSGTANGGGGGGGAATIWGLGGAGGNAVAAGSNAAATSYGAGGGGGGGTNGTFQAGGNGAPGYVLIGYVA